MKVDKLQYYLIDTTKFLLGESVEGYQDSVFKAAIIAQGVLDGEIADQKYYPKE